MRKLRENLVRSIGRAIRNYDDLRLFGRIVQLHQVAQFSPYDLFFVAHNKNDRDDCLDGRSLDRTGAQAASHPEPGGIAQIRIDDERKCAPEHESHLTSEPNAITWATGKEE